MAIPKIESYELPLHAESDRAALPWKVEVGSAALLIHDMQNYFLEKYRSGTFVQQLVDRIAGLRRRCVEAGIPVFYSAQSGGKTRQERGLLFDRWGIGMPAEGDGRNIVAGLEPARADQVLEKHHYSAFKRNGLLSQLRRAQRTQLIICGVYAHIGCLATATEAFMEEIQPFAVADAMADFSPHHHRAALQHIAECSGVVLSADELLNDLATPSVEALRSFA